MSRIGKKSIEIPEKVKMDITDTGSIKVEGPKGKLEWVLPEANQASHRRQTGGSGPRYRDSSGKGAARPFAQSDSQHGDRCEPGVPERT